MTVKDLFTVQRVGHRVTVQPAQNRQSRKLKLDCPFGIDFTFRWKHIAIMSAAGGTFRGTPSRGGHGRGQVPSFENNSPSNIPRPKLENHASSALQSESGTSTLSASRQKQAKRDEVRSNSSMLPPECR